jgi:hypothetical protein
MNQIELSRLRSIKGDRGNRDHRIDEDLMHQRRMLYLLTYLALAFSIGHHLDHVVRGNATGWPLTPEVNAFTASLVIYPLIITGLLLYRARRVGAGFWAFLSGGGAVFVTFIHFGPQPAEPSHLIHGGYASPILGSLAYGWLMAFIGVLIVTHIYELRVWYAERRSRAGQLQAAAEGDQP